MHTTNRPDERRVFILRAGRTHSFVLAVTTKFSGAEPTRPVSHGLDVGGKMSGCLRMTVTVPDPALAGDERFRDLYASARVCSVQSDLPRGDGTRHMVRAAMTHVLREYSWIDAFSLTDASSVTCAETGRVIDLLHLSVMTSGRSYYEKYFGAELQHQWMRDAYAADVAKLRDPAHKVDFAAFVKAYDVAPEQARIIRGAFLGASTYLDFFAELKRQCDEERTHAVSFCEVLTASGRSRVDAWSDVFMRHMLSSADYRMTKWVVRAGSACVYVPALPCAGDLASASGSGSGSNTAGKVYAPGRRATMAREIGVMRRMREIDPAGSYHARLKRVCQVSPGAGDSATEWSTQLVLARAVQTLREFVQKKSPSFVPILLRGLVNVAQGIVLMADAGLVHQDITPDNIMLRDDDSFVLVDFGISFPATAIFAPQRVNMMRNTWLYNPPEYKVFASKKATAQGIARNYAALKALPPPLPSQISDRSWMTTEASRVAVALKSDVFKLGVVIVWLASEAVNVPVPVRRRLLEVGVRLADMDASSRPDSRRALSILKALLPKASGGS
ncbi:hypothetical protein FOA52_005803 [Chlamydomonas sp. UWO 241]|nr:hypothetical protein FOA52_005803 [Chlamydomonas sp. UWO 241]